MSITSGCLNLSAVMFPLHAEGKDSVSMLLVDEDRSVEDLLDSMTLPADDGRTED